MATAADATARFHELLAACEPAALEYLYQYAPRLELALRRKFGAIIAPEDIKDIVRDGLIRALRTGDRFDPGVAKITTWLNTLVHYEALEFLRRNLGVMSLECVNQGEIKSPHQHRAADQRPSPAIEHILQRLPKQRATILRMHYYEGRSYEEIARLLEITQATVKSHLSNARNDIRKELDADRRAA